MSFFHIHEHRRRAILPVAGLVLAALYFLVYRPLGEQAKQIEIPLEASWAKLAAALGASNATSLDFAAVTNRLQQTRRSAAVLQTVEQRAAARIELAEAVRARMRGEFQLVDYQNERQKVIDDLTKLARQHKVTFEPAVMSGFPEHTADMKQPWILWAELALIDHLLTSAVNCQVATVHALTVPLILTNALAAPASASLLEIPLQVELTGPLPALTHFLQSLPLRADEAKAEGLPPVSADKPALFIDRILVRRQSPERADEARLWLRVVGFALRDKT